MTSRLSPGSRLALASGLLLIATGASARTFISPMGEPFRDAPSGKDTAEMWFEGADKDGDGRITRAEFLADAGRFFKTLDVNHDGEIGPEEIERYEEDVAPEVQTNGFFGGGGGGHGHGGGGRGHGRGGHRGGGGGGGGGGGSSEGESGGDSSEETHAPAYDATPQGAERFSYLDLPEPVSAADADFNRGVSAKEFVDAANQRFDMLDANQDGVLTRDDLPGLSRAGGEERRGRKGHGPDAPPR